MLRAPGWDGVGIQCMLLNVSRAYWRCWLVSLAVRLAHQMHPCEAHLSGKGPRALVRLVEAAGLT